MVFAVAGGSGGSGGSGTGWSSTCFLSVYSIAAQAAFSGGGGFGSTDETDDDCAAASKLDDGAAAAVPTKVSGTGFCAAHDFLVFLERQWRDCSCFFWQ